MERNGKRTRAASKAGTSKQPSTSKQRKTASADWCADCWKAVEDACRGSHRLVDGDTAEKEVQGEFKAAQQEMVRVQARVDVLTAARVLKGPVLNVHVEGLDEQSWAVDGGDMRIALATTKNLTAKEKTAICEALDDLEVDYKTKGTASTMAYGRVNGLDGVLNKLPDCLGGQAVRKGAVLLSGGQLQVYFRDTPSERSHGAKVFGHVQSGLDSLEGHGCDGDCERFDLDCFCRGGGPTGTTLGDAEFVA